MDTKTPAHHQSHAAQLEKRVNALSDVLAHWGRNDDLKELILILKRPGWTTPAEFIFATAIVDSMMAHTSALTNLRAELLRGSEAVVTR